jgi:hypothetical protein
MKQHRETRLRDERAHALVSPKIRADFTHLLDERTS